MKLQFDSSFFSAAAQELADKLMMLEVEMRDEVSKEMVTTMTDRLLVESVERTPILDGMLIASQIKEVENSTGQWIGHVFVPANSPGADYALYIHEAEYKLGEASQQKQAGQSAIVGRKFLERAFVENIDTFDIYIRARLGRFFADGK